ncbi:conjugal transfer protein TraN [Legionella sp.]|uniref:conjugal transfer protein TraN n=1 Tax=Legionella sp. TaxID=459 RepID=UPI0032204174
MVKALILLLSLMPYPCLANAIDKNLDPNTPEMRDIDHLLENSDAILESAEFKGKIACANGECDHSQAEVSTDAQEGISRLGALAGSAVDVSSQQISSGIPAIFSGRAQECEKYPLNFRDCCTDSGWGDWIVHCPHELQVLQQAKAENRVVYLGNYKKHKLGSRHYRYCVFPTKLAALVQIQGRGRPLRLPFGTAKHPDCRGLTPDELERIDFGSLDLTAIQQELMARMILPNTNIIGSQNHIEQLVREQRTHD